MEFRREGISRKSIPNQIDSIGYGYVMVPRLVDRSEYVDTIYRKQKIDIYPDQGGSPILDCRISKNILQLIDFPEDENSLGSCVLYVTPKFNNKPIVIGILSKEDDVEILKEGLFNIKKVFGDNVVEIEGDAETGVLNINVVTYEDSSVVNLNVIGNEDSILNLSCSGKVEVSADEGLLLKSSSSIEERVYDLEEKGTFTSVKKTKDEVQIQPKKKFLIGEGKQAFVLGDNLKETLVSFQETVNNINEALSLFATTQSAVSTGALAPLKPGYEALKLSLEQESSSLSSIAEKLELILSKLSYTD